MGYFFKPNIYNDLYRIYDQMNYYSSISFGKFFSNFLVKSNVPISLLYYWFIGQLPIRNLLPFITCFIFYSNIFYIMCDFCKKEKCSNSAISLSLLIIMCNSSFMEVISGIRNMLSFSILLKCFYDEFYNKKPVYKNFIYYVIACLIHQSCIILVFLRVLFLFFEKKLLKKRKFSIYLLTFVLLILAFYIGKPYIINSLSKGMSYVITDGYSYIWETILSSFILISLIFIKFRCKKFNFLDENYAINLNNNKNFSRILEIIAIIFIFEHSIFFRINNFNLFLNLPIILTYTNELFKQNNKNYKFVYLSYTLILIISCIRGDLCSLKFWG